VLSETRLVRAVADELEQAGLRASLVVRDLDSGREIALAADAPLPAASLGKVPLALAVLERVHSGMLDGGLPVRVEPGASGTPGTGRFVHPATIAVEDLVSLAVTVSDDNAADALLDLVPPHEVTAHLEELGIRGIVLRHPFGALADTPLERFAPDEAHLAHTLAIRGGTPAQGHPVPQLDVARTNIGTATAWADLLEAVWRDRGVRPAVAARVREHLAGNVHRQRLAPDFAADGARWSSKTGTLLNLRHEAGVVEHADGSRIAVVALSASTVPASHQPAAEAALGAAARRLHDALRQA
jgi:beta-lactamase class A